MNLKLVSPLLFCLLATTAAFGQLDHSISPAEQIEAGRDLAQKWRDAVPAENADYHGVLKIRRGDEVEETIPLTFKIIAGQPTWRTVYEAKATAKSPAQTLVIIRAPDRPNQYLFATAAHLGEPVGEPKPLSRGQTALPFAGSDFSLADLGLEFLHWPTQRLLRTEMRKGQVTKLLESVSPEEGAYGRVLTWLDKDSGAPILAEAYDRRGKLLKEFSIKSVRKVNNQYLLQEMQIRNLQTGSRTRIEYDLNNE